MLPNNVLALFAPLLVFDVSPLSRVQTLLSKSKNVFLDAFLGVESVATGPIVDTGYAKYLGNHTSQFPSTIVYYGIPYAEPPVGERRFRAPVELNETRVEDDARGEVVDARNPAGFCVQGGRDNLAGGAGSEDCLKVNVYTPVGGSDLPVLIFFHGGGYIFGNPLNFPFDHWFQPSPSGPNPNIIIVSVYYRISSLGFLAHPSFRVHGPNRNSLGDLNAGFLDQVEALKWIQRNIASFGGDPRRVTIDGHSAGASSIELHLVGAASDVGREVYGFSDGCEGEGGGRDGRLFTQAIAQSTYRVPVPTPEQQEPLFDFYAEHAGCKTGTVSDKMACLRKADIGDLARAQDLAMTDALDNPYKFFRPVVDGKLIPDYPSKLIMNGKSVKVPLLIGATSNETSIPQGDIEVSLKMLFPLLTSTDIEEFLRVYPAKDFTSSYQHFQVTTGESVFMCSVSIIADAFTQSPSPTPTNDVWAYRYNEPNPSTSMGNDVVAHSAETWMMFRGTNTRNNGTSNWTTLERSDVAFSEELIAYWVSFVKAGDPNVYKLARSPEWGRYGSSSSSRSTGRMVLRKVRGDDEGGGAKLGGAGVGERGSGSGSYMEVVPVKERQRCEFVKGKVEKEQN